MKTKSSKESALTSMPNIGNEAASWLMAAGIKTPQDLCRLGSVKAACRIRTLRPNDPPCRSMLAALEGAIRGIRWHAIPKTERDALWKKYLTSCILLLLAVRFLSAGDKGTILWQMSSWIM